MVKIGPKEAAARKLREQQQGPRTGIVPLSTVSETGSLSAKVNLDAQAKKDAKKKMPVVVPAADDDTSIPGFLRRTADAPKTSAAMADSPSQPVIVSAKQDKSLATLRSVYRVPASLSDDEAKEMIARVDKQKKETTLKHGEAYRQRQAQLKQELLDKANKLRAEKGLPLIKPRGKKKSSTTPKADQPKAQPKESTMRTATKTKATTVKARASAKSHDNAQPRGMAIEIGKLASRPNGASRAELIKLTGWKQQAWKWYFHNSHDNGFCQKFGYKLTVIEGKDGESRYRISKK